MLQRVGRNQAKGNLFTKLLTNISPFYCVIIAKNMKTSYQEKITGMGAIPFSKSVAFRVWAPNADSVLVTGTNGTELSGFGTIF